MIAKISRGWRVEGLVRYLMGPGRFNEHRGQRVVASWDGAPELHQPAQVADGSFDVRGLVDGLSAAAVAAGVGLREPVVGAGERVPQGPVWHCSLRNSPEDPVLSDEQWSRVVEDLMHRTGIAERGDPDGCRWVAIRHADDHVHVAAVLVGQESGRRVHPYRDFVRARETCQDWERELGLTPTAAADRSSVTGPSQAEQEKAARRGVGASSREWLRGQVRVAAVQARDPEGFAAALADLGVLVRLRRGAEGVPGSVVGYAVAAPGDVNASGEPVWFSGRTLASDLSLPALQRRWASAPVPQVEVEAGPYRARVGPHRARVGPQERAAAISGAVSAMEHAAATLGSGETGVGADGVAHAAGDMLSAVGAVTGWQGLGGRVGRDAGDDFDRATRVPGPGLPSRWSPVARELRSAAWRLASVRTVGRGGDGDAAQLVLALAVLVAEVAALREAQARLVQAQAARRSCGVLRGAVSVASVRAGASGPGRDAAPVPGRQRPQPQSRPRSQSSATGPVRHAQPQSQPQQAPQQDSQRRGRSR